MRFAILIGAVAMVRGAQDAGELPRFEVVSVKPSHERGNESNFDSLPNGRTTATNITVQELIRLAYGVNDYQITRAPGWVDSDRYDIAAKTAEGG